MLPDTPDIPQSAFPELLRELGPIFGSQVTVDTSLPEPTQKGTAAQPDLIIRIGWQATSQLFTAELKTRNTPRVIEDAAHRAQRQAAASGLLPMVIAPFLAEDRLDQLMREGVSGLDLCGNGLVIVPGTLMLRRTGEPNRYPESVSSRFAYRGATSLVPRAFLRKPMYTSVGQIQREVLAAGGSVALSTVSKALSRMEDDLVIDRSRDRIMLLQPEKLLGLLAAEFLPPKAGRISKTKLSGSISDLFSRIRSGAPVRLTLSGASSQSYYTAGLRADQPVLYCENLDQIRSRTGLACPPDERFADVTIIETADPTPFFDTRSDADGVIYTSPVQTYVELLAGDEKRDRQIAEQVREQILAELPKSA